jgi:hypothetical protein
MATSSTWVAGASDWRGHSLNLLEVRKANVFLKWAAAWRREGFLDVEETLLGIRMAFTSFADYWLPYLGKDGPGAEHVNTLNESERVRLEAAVKSAYLDGEADGPRSYAALAWAVKGVKP